MTQKQMVWIAIYIISIIMFIFAPYKVGMWMTGGNDSCVLATWIVGLFTMAVVAVGGVLGVIAYNFLKNK